MGKTIKRLEIYGDSILRGVTYNGETGRYDLFRKDRFSELSAAGIETANHSRMGATVLRGLDILRRNLKEDAGDTVVLLEYGGNDCDHPWAEVSKDPAGQYCPNVSMEQYVDTYREAIRTVRQRGAFPVIASLVPIDADKYMHWISKNLSYDNILSWLGDVSMLSRWQENYNRTVERLAFETGTPLLDLRGVFLLSHDYKSILSEDGIHPTPQGHALIDGAMTEFVTKLA